MRGLPRNGPAGLKAFIARFAGHNRMALWIEKTAAVSAAAFASISKSALRRP